MSGNIYRPVVDGEILPEYIRQGESYGNVSFGRNATVETYAEHGLYLQEVNKPESNQYQTVEKINETVDEVRKVVTIQYAVNEKAPAVVAAIKKREAQEVMDTTLDAGAEYNGVVYQCKLADVDQFNRGLALIDLTNPATIDCRAMDNSMHTLTVAEYREMCTVVATAYETALRTYWAAVDAI